MKKELTKIQKYMIIGVLVLTAAFVLSFAMNQIKDYGKTDQLEKVEGAAEEIVKSKAQVQVAGEVVNPGIYEAELDMRVQEVIEMAGGFTDKANVEKVNLVQYVKDGQKIDVPAIKETSSSSSKSSSSKSSTSKASTSSKKSTTAKAAAEKTAKPAKEKTPEPEATPEPTEAPNFSIHLNSSSAEDFASVDGVSNSVGANIVAYREENGPFGSTEELMDVPGVTSKVYNALVPFIQD